MSARALLWGIDGDLKGNEDRLMARLPILRFEEDGRLALARTHQWSRGAERTLAWLADEAHADDVGTRLDLPKPVWIESAQIVAVIGQRYRTAARISCTHWFPHLVHSLRCPGVTPAWVRDSLLGEQEPSVWPLSIELYDTITAAIAASARRAFDVSIRNASDDCVPAEAEAALLILRGTPGARLDDQVVRQLVLSRLQHDMDRYRRTLELAALRMGEPPERIERWANEMLPPRSSYLSTAAHRQQDSHRSHDTHLTLDCRMSQLQRIEVLISSAKNLAALARDAARLTDDLSERELYNQIVLREQAAICELGDAVASRFVHAGIGA